MNQELLSVIITTYKRSFPLIRQSLDCVLGQDYPQIELILVDDNPTPSAYSDEIVRALADYPQVKYLKMPRNSGACAARNMGILHAEGEFIGFLDDDDLWLPTKASSQLRLMADPEVMLTYSMGQVFSGNDLESLSPYTTTDGFRERLNYGDLLMRDWIGSTSQAIIRKSCLCKSGLFDPDMPCRQDYDMWLRITACGYVAQGVPEPLYLHRLHEGEQITKDAKKAVDGILRIYRKHHDDYRRNSEAHFQILTHISSKYRVCGEKLHGFAYLLKALLCAPGPFVRGLMQKLHAK